MYNNFRIISASDKLTHLELNRPFMRLFYCIYVFLYLMKTDFSEIDSSILIAKQNTFNIKISDGKFSESIERVEHNLNCPSWPGTCKKYHFITLCLLVFSKSLISSRQILTFGHCPELKTSEILVINEFELNYAYLSLAYINFIYCNLRQIDLSN